MKKIKVKISAIKERSLGAYMYTYYVTFPTSPNYAYTIRATEEGFMHTTQIWEKAGYEVEFFNSVPA